VNIYSVNYERAFPVQGVRQLECAAIRRERKKAKMAEIDRVKQFVLAVTDAAITDVQSGIPERHPTNTGDRLVDRLNLRAIRAEPRNGDAKYARSLYTAAYFLYETEKHSG
jgi:hypothetical protein